MVMIKWMETIRGKNGGVLKWGLCVSGIPTSSVKHFILCMSLNLSFLVLMSQIFLLDKEDIMCLKYIIPYLIIQLYLQPHYLSINPSTLYNWMDSTILFHNRRVFRWVSGAPSAFRGIHFLSSIQTNNRDLWFPPAAGSQVPASASLPSVPQLSPVTQNTAPNMRWFIFPPLAYTWARTLSALLCTRASTLDLKHASKDCWFSWSSH